MFSAAGNARRFRVAVLRNDDFPVRTELVRERLASLAVVDEVDIPFRQLSPAEEDAFLSRLGKAEGLFVRAGYITRRIFEALPDLKVVTVHGAGVDQVDLAAARDHGVVVTNCPGANARSVMELTFALMLALMRDVPAASGKVQHDGVWDEARTLGREIGGKTLGIVGLGHVGRQVAHVATAFDMKVIGYDPLVKESPVPLVPLDRLLQEADVVSLHVPLVDSTRHLIGEEELRKMKSSAVLINTSRGPVVDQAALLRALNEKWISGAALDVVDPEPPAPDEPLLNLDNVIVTPHIGGSTIDCLERIAKIGAEDMARVLSGQQPVYPVL